MELQALGDPRFLGTAFGDCPDWQILQVYNRVIERRQELANERSYSAARMCVLWLDEKSKRTLNREYDDPAIAFLPFPAVVESRSDREMQECSRETALVFMRLYREKRLPRRMISTLGALGLLDKVRSLAT